MSKITDMQNQLFGTNKNYVCGGHGARRPSHGTFQVPSGITIKFYIRDGDSLPNSIGQEIDRIIGGGTAPVATETVVGGATCRNYHLYSSRAGGYLNLGMSSSANPNYITTNDKENGMGLKEIATMVARKSHSATIHWSACRALENDGDSFGWSKPKYSNALLHFVGAI